MRFRTRNWRNLREFFMRGQSGYDIVIPRHKEAEHGQIVGDTGTGKSTWLTQILYQIRDRGDAAVILDLNGQYLSRFWHKRAVVINPADTRGWAWNLGGECIDAATSIPVGHALFPDDPREHKYFLEQSRAILSYLVETRHPSTKELADWLARGKRLDELVKGTHHADSLSKKSDNQRSGILSTLNRIRPALSMIQTPAEAEGTFCAREWSRDPQGFVFLTSSPQTRDAVRPIHSAILDLLMLALQYPRDFSDNSRRVWFILDELTSLNQLPQLENAITRQRKSGNPIWMAFQNRAQMEEKYGRLPAQVILSQPATNIVLRTQEPDSAKHLEKLIGDHKIVRIEESRGGGRGRKPMYSSRELVEPVVPASTIQTLPNLRGYFKFGDRVVKIKFRPLSWDKCVAPPLIERIIPPMQVFEDEEEQDDRQPVMAGASTEMPRPGTRKRKYQPSEQEELAFLRQTAEMEPRAYEK